MKYSSIDQWKSKIKKLAKENGIDVQDMQQRYILEEFARMISESKYKHSIILKGGFVVSALLGIDERKTRDIDFTFNSTIYDIDQIKEILESFPYVTNICGRIFKSACLGDPYLTKVSPPTCTTE